MSERTGVIHDLGYRGYSGPRLGQGSIIGALLRQGVLSTFGFGRSGRAKGLPFALLAMTLVPAIVQVGIMTFVGLQGGSLDYAGYLQGTSMFVALFVAAQAPVLFTRDLRSGAISLYLARPLGPTVFALVRWASLVLATLVFLVVPLVLLLLGGLGAGADAGEELPRWGVAVLGSLLLAVLLSTVGAVVSSLTTRRGLAVGGSVIALFFGLGVTVAVQEVASNQGNQTLATWLGVLSPWTLTDSVQAGLSDATGSFPAPAQDATTGTLMLLVGLAAVAAGLLLLVRRYRSKGAR